jgi:two-component system LytT family response regulator
MSPESLRLLVADDEPLARELIRRYAAGQPGITIVAEAASGDELAEELARTPVDAALVDVRMPGEDVFTVIARAAASRRPLPAVIFSTAFDLYAVRAFDLNAVDYLIKPYTQERFAEALRRARRHRAAAAVDAVARAARDLGPRPDRLLVPDGRRLVPIATSSIVWIKAEGDFARVHTADRNYLVSRSLKDLESRLDPAQFIRIHRSAMVSSSHIREVRPAGSSRYRVGLADGTTVIVSRSRAAGLRKWKI